MFIEPSKQLGGGGGGQGDGNPGGKGTGSLQEVTGGRKREGGNWEK